jgi:SOS response associated peptidase (SRAP)
MCANYHPVTAQDRLVQYFGVERPIDAVPPDLYPGGLAPFIVRERDRVELARDVRMGLFGLLPHWAKDLAFGRRTYNARSETVSEKPSFRDAWRRGRALERGAPRWPADGHCRLVGLVARARWARVAELHDVDDQRRRTRGLQAPAPRR